MKRNLRVLMLAAALVLTAGFGFALSGATMHVTVPFDFYAGSRLLPAGEYTFEMTSGATATGSMVTVITREGAAVCTLGARPGRDAASGRLLFHKYGDTYFLSGVSIQGFRAEVPMPDGERELRARIAGSGEPPVLALR